MKVFRSDDPMRTYYESSETGERVYLDGLPVEVDGPADDLGFLFVSFPTVGVAEYPVRPHEIIDSEGE